NAIRVPSGEIDGSRSHSASPTAAGSAEATGAAGEPRATTEAASTSSDEAPRRMGTPIRARGRHARPRAAAKPATAPPRAGRTPENPPIVCGTKTDVRGAYEVDIGDPFAQRAQDVVVDVLVRQHPQHESTRLSPALLEALAESRRIARALPLSTSGLGLRAQ